MAVIKERERYTAASLRRWQPRLSYQVSFNTEKEDHYWVVSMPKPKVEAEYGIKQEETTEQFVLFKAMNLQRGQVSRGGATRIWKVWQFENLLLPPEKRQVRLCLSQMQRSLTCGQVFILKDSWRHSNRRLEGEFYERIGPKLECLCRPQALSTQPQTHLPRSESYEGNNSKNHLEDTTTVCSTCYTVNRRDDSRYGRRSASSRSLVHSVDVFSVCLSVLQAYREQ